jgi:hypothetical protein
MVPALAKGELTRNAQAAVTAELATANARSAEEREAASKARTEAAAAAAATEARVAALTSQTEQQKTQVRAADDERPLSAPRHALSPPAQLKALLSEQAAALDKARAAEVALEEANAKVRHARAHARTPAGLTHRPARRSGSWRCRSRTTGSARTRASARQARPPTSSNSWRPPTASAST